MGFHDDRICQKDRTHVRAGGGVMWLSPCERHNSYSIARVAVKGLAALETIPLMLQAEKLGTNKELRDQIKTDPSYHTPELPTSTRGT